MILALVVVAVAIVSIASSSANPYLPNRVRVGWNDGRMSLNRFFVSESLPTRLVPVSAAV